MDEIKAIDRVVISWEFRILIVFLILIKKLRKLKNFILNKILYKKNRLMSVILITLFNSFAYNKIKKKIQICYLIHTFIKKNFSYHLGGDYFNL